MSTHAHGQHVRPGHSTMYWLAHVVTVGLVVGYLVLTVPGANPAGFPLWEAVWLNLATLAAALLCWIRGRRGPLRLAWKLVALGIAAQVIGDQTWQLLVMHHVPRPPVSLADPFWLAYYPLIAGALIVIVRSRLAEVSAARILDGLLAGLATATLVIIVVFPAVLQHIDNQPLRAAVSLVYPVLDVLLLSVALATVSVFGWRPPRSVWWLCGATATWTLFDCIYNVQAADGKYVAGSWVDVIGLFAALLAALAPGWPQPATVPTYPRWLPFAAPFFATSSALVVLLVDSVAHVPPIASYLTAATVAASLARLATAVGDALRAGEHEFLALTDDLTGLPNRRSLYEQARTLLPEPGEPPGPPVALLLLDLDHFKDVNDSLGHAAGDLLLRTVAARLTSRLRREDVLVRLGGDEFALLLPDCGPSEALAVGSDLRAVLDEPVVLDDVRVQVGGSIGIALSPTHGTDIATLLRLADIAMYRAKAGPHSCQIYDPAPLPAISEVDSGNRANTRADMLLLEQLRTAIGKRQLAVFYQPQVRLDTGKIIGVEALVRWPHPEHGLLSPDKFLPLVHQNRLMQAMTNAVLDIALDDAAVFYQAGHRIPVSVNLFPPSFGDVDLPNRIAAELARRGLPPAALDVEITEQFMFGDPRRARVVLDQLHAQGVGIAVDDFGTGYSALSYLYDLAIDHVKLDRSFIEPITHDPRAAAITRSVIELAHTIGMTAIAEGVEDSITAALLTDFGCDHAQGYYYHKPMPYDDLMDLLARS